jgi:ribosomal protein S20
MKKKRSDVDFLYLSELKIVEKWEHHHFRNMGTRSLIRSIHKSIRQSWKNEVRNELKNGIGMQNDR